ncbi:MAG: isoprenyl transferase [Acidobacteriota bacterium]
MAARSSKEPIIDHTRLPRHIAIIMDGNGRWAKKRLLPRQAGHRAGIEALRKTIEASGEMGISILTVYAFSTENWKRPQDEVSYLMNLLLEYLSNELQNLHEKNVQIRVIGDKSRLEMRIQAELGRSIELTRNNNGLILNIALNYGGRSEIIQAARAIALQVKDDQLDINDITEDCFDGFLYTKEMPDPDLLIRTAGEMRISNFLLWQIAYSEIWVTDVLWPDFDGKVLAQAVAEYQKRERRFGGVEAK